MDLKTFLNQETVGCFIDGKLSGKESESLISPLTKQHWKTIRTASLNDCKHAILSAEKAFLEWKEVPSPLRAQILRKIGSLMSSNKELLAHIMAMEMGKSIKDGFREVDYAAGFFHWFAGEAERIYGLTIPSQFPDKRLMIQWEAVGVCGLITPWNFPLAMGARKIAPALAAGCTIILKPSQECPVSMAAFAHLCHLAELPPGVFNLLIGPEKEIGQSLLESNAIRKISFTGSCEVGKYLFQHSANTLKKLTMELGGHAPLLVFDDASIDKAVKGCIEAKFRNNGQTCIAPNRVLIQNKIYDSFIERLIPAVQKLKSGNPLDPETDVSNILHHSASEKVKNHIEDAIHKGAIPLLLGKKPHDPTVLSEVTDNMLIFNEETFGPVISITKFQTIEEGIKLANQSPYGLSSYAFTESLTTAYRAIKDLQYGIIGINDGLPSTPQASFGGIKHSGLGREGGPNGLKEYLIEKYVSFSL